ncbi:MAG: hypothetical protein AB1758_33030 [Candidatus Eremiobacterota bacterium]
MHRRLAWGLILWALLAGSAPAQFPVDPAGREIVVDLVPTDRAGKAAGKLRLKPRTARLEVSGLLPGGVYTVRLLRERPFESRGLGPRPHSFQADAEGRAAFDAPLTLSERVKWQLLLISYHPGGDPSDTRDVKPVLRARLPDR